MVFFPTVQGRHSTAGALLRDLCSRFSLTDEEDCVRGTWSPGLNPTHTQTHTKTGVSHTGFGIGKI